MMLIIENLNLISVQSGISQISMFWWSPIMKPPFHVLKSKTYSEKRNNLRLVLWLSRMLLLEGDTDVKKKHPFTQSSYKGLLL